MTKFGSRILVALNTLIMLFMFSTCSLSAQSIGNLAFSKDSSERMLMIIFGLAAAVEIILFALFGKEKKFRAAQGICSLDGMTPAEAGYIHNGYCRAEDIVSLILYWADKGYLSINRITEAGTDEIVLFKLKDADSAMKPFEKLVFDKLFRGKTNVALKDLKGNLRIRMRKVNAELANIFRAQKNKLITTASGITTVVGFLFSALSIGVMPIFTATFENANIADGIAFYSIFNVLIALCFCIMLKFFKIMNDKRFGICLLLYIIFLMIMMLISRFTLTSIISCACAAVCGILSVYSRKHTKRGRELLEKVLGLKEFMISADKSSAEAILKENPSLFYHLLPFAYALGVEDKWAVKFKNIAIAKPDWYKSNSYGIFSPIYFTNIFNEIVAKKLIATNGFAISAFASNKGFQTSGNTPSGPR